MLTLFYHLLNLNCMHSFIAYIDESGDDGFGNYRGPNSGGASNWLGISSLLIRASNQLETVKWRDEIKNTTGKKNKGRSIHFVDFDHNQKRVACQILSKKPCRFTSAIAHKPSLAPSNFQGKNQLYFYITRYVIERISWFCRDMRPEVGEGDGRVKIIFSRRGGMSYEDFKRYLSDLKKNPTANTVHWPVIDIDAIEAKDHSRDAGLQIADCMASATAWALEPDRFGNTEQQYLQSLKPNIYTRNDNILSYGLKLLPNKQDIQSNQNIGLFVGEFG